MPEEALSSWIARLAAAMGVRNEDLLVAGLDMPPLTDDQLDYQPPPALRTRLAERTTVPVDALRAMTVEGYVPLLIDQLTPTPDLMQTYAGQYWFFVIPEGRESQRSLALVPWQASAQRRMRTCPLCLRDDARPSRRIYWRLAWMGSCPDHGVLLEERPRLIWAQDEEEAQPPMVAHPDLLFLDGLTLQAITLGAVVLPNGYRLHGGSWLRMVRALIDELCLTITEAQQASATLRVFWTTHGLGYREGVRRLRPFEMHPPDRQRRLLTVAGTAIRMLCEGQVVSRSPGARLLAPCAPRAIWFPDLLMTVEVVPARGTPQPNPRWTRCSNSGLTSVARILRVPPICVSGFWPGTVAMLIQQRMWTTSSPSSGFRLSRPSHFSKHSPSRRQRIYDILCAIL